MLITITNLFLRPDQPTRAMFNFQLFREMERMVAGYPLFVTRETDNKQPITNNYYLNICLVPEWRVWRWPEIRRWKAPRAGAGKSCQVAELLREESAGGTPVSISTTEQLNNLATDSVPTVYLPVFYLPFIGRSINWWFYYRALRGRVNRSLFSVDGNTNNQQPLTNNRENGAQCAVLASWLYPDAVAVARLAKELGVPVWLRVHGTDRYHLKNRRRRRLILEAVDYAQGVICNARAVADDLAKWGVPAAKIHIIPNGVDTSLFHYRTKEDMLELFGARNAPETPHLNPLTLLLRQGYGGHEGERKDGNQGNMSGYYSAPSPSRGEGGGEGDRSEVSGLRSQVFPASGGTILFVGNLVPIKGPDVLLRAFAALGETADHRPETIVSSPPPHLLLIGSGPMRAQLERLARELGIADRVQFLGNRPHHEIARWMNVADVLCLASHSEGMPNVVLEARASGLPVVTTPAGAVPELPLDRDYFLVAKSCSPRDLAEGLRDMLSRDLSIRTPDPAIPSWHQTAKTILALMDCRGVGTPAANN